MNNAKARKLQYLLITELLEKGSVELQLPDGITLEIGILQENELGESVKADDYCYVVATRGSKSTVLDTYNLAMMFEEEKGTFVFEDELTDPEGRVIKTMEVI
jgi:hypothetical protein